MTVPVPPVSVSRPSLRAARATASSVTLMLLSPALCAASNPADAVGVQAPHLFAANSVQVVHEAPHVWSGLSSDPIQEVDLSEALSDLGQAVDEAHDEGFRRPSDAALGNADRLLRDMYRLRGCRFEVYPTQDGEVAVSAPGGHGRSVLVLCDSDGGVLCSVNLNGQHRRAVYDPDSAVQLPDGFVREALVALDA